MNPMKKIMIIGAGLSQVPAIEQAKNMGLETVVIDGSDKAPGLKLAHHREIISTKDVEGAIQAAKKYDIDGVLTIATDSGVMSVAGVATELGLPGISQETARLSTNKFLMRSKFKEAGVPSPEFGRCSTVQEARELVEKIGMPVIFKPEDNAGSLGVIMLSSISELENCFEFTKASSFSGSILVEEYLDGPEVSVESLTYDGKTTILAITDKMTSQPPYCVELGHTMPSELSDDVQEDIKKVAKMGLEALGVDIGAGHTEIKITKEGPKIVEIGARMGGWIGADMVVKATGIDMTKEAIRISLGDMPDIEQKYSRGVAIRIFTSKSGLIIDINGIELIKKLDGMEILDIYLKPGDKIKPLHSGFDRIGRVLATGDTREDAVKIAEDALKKLQVVIR